MKLKRLAALASIIALSGCAGANTALQYNQTTHYVQMADDKYRVFEHPKGDRIMITPSLGATVKLGVANMSLIPGYVPTTPFGPQEAAARQYLNETGRANCKITQGKLVMEPQHEFFFTCS